MAARMFVFSDLPNDGGAGRTLAPPVNFTRKILRDLTELDAYRVTDPKHSYWAGDGTCGMFLVPFSATGVTLKCVASANEGWDHVSVSLTNRIPNWLEMQHIHRTFFRDGEVAWEYHVPPKDHVNFHSYVLHLWRKHGFEMPMPPVEFV